MRLRVAVHDLAVRVDREHLVLEPALARLDRAEQRRRPDLGDRATDPIEDRRLRRAGIDGALPPDREVRRVGLEPPVQRDVQPRHGHILLGRRRAARRAHVDLQRGDVDRAADRGGERDPRRRQREPDRHGDRDDAPRSPSPGASG
jgi:hypothetical protein